MSNMKVSAWLCQRTDSHAIQDSTKMAELFKKETGRDAPWHDHSEASTARAIEARGKGGSLTRTKKGKEAPRLCYGYEMAEACATQWTEGFKSWQTGLGFRFNTAIEALTKAGL